MLNLLKKTVDVLQHCAKKRDEMIEKLISMVENLQTEIKIKNAELEKYREFNEERPEETI